MNRFMFACAVGITGAVIGVACAPTVVPDAGSAGPGGMGAGGHTGGSGAGTPSSSGTGTDAGYCVAYDADVGDAGWGCDNQDGFLPAWVYPGVEVCAPDAYCSWDGAYQFYCGKGCHFIAAHPHKCSAPFVCLFNHGWGPPPSDLTDPNEYFQGCEEQYCQRFPDGHWACCGAEASPGPGPLECPCP